MSEVRLDPLTRRSVVLQPSRIPAPPAYLPGTLPMVASCPFCPGQEHRTRSTIQQRPEGVWQARAFANRRPAFLPELVAGERGDGMLRGRVGVGAHEVIVETRDHTGLDRTGQLTTLQLAADRMQDLTQDTRFAAVSWFRNRCVEAGSSQPHPHSQIVATPHLPDRLATIAHTQEQRPGLLMALANRAEQDNRVVLQTAQLRAFTPWAPQTPYEVWIVPRVPVAQLWTDRALLPDVASMLHGIRNALDRLAGRAAHHVVSYGAPLREACPAFCWHLRVLPRLQRPGGYEAWSGEAMHPILPEDAAAVLRGFVA